MRATCICLRTPGHPTITVPQFERARRNRLTASTSAAGTWDEVLISLSWDLGPIPTQYAACHVRPRERFSITCRGSAQRLDDPRRIVMHACSRSRTLVPALSQAMKWTTKRGRIMAFPSRDPGALPHVRLMSRPRSRTSTSRTATYSGAGPNGPPFRSNACIRPLVHRADTRIDWSMQASSTQDALPHAWNGPGGIASAVTLRSLLGGVYSETMAFSLTGLHVHGCPYVVKRIRARRSESIDFAYASRGSRCIVHDGLHVLCPARLFVQDDLSDASRSNPKASS